MKRNSQYNRHTLLLAALLMACSATTSADRYDNDDDYRHKHSEYARVIDSTPIYRSEVGYSPQRECRIESVAYQDYSRDHNNYSNHNNDNRYNSGTPLILGGLTGGAIGYNLGNHKDAKNAGAVLGALLGGSIGRDLYQSNRRQANHYTPQSITRYRDQEVCETRQRRHYNKVIDGYDVRYRYQGRIYNSRMQHRPGKRIRVGVDVYPQEKRRNKHRYRD